jgi:hypothetical protein
MRSCLRDQDHGAGVRVRWSVLRWSVPGRPHHACASCDRFGTSASRSAAHSSRSTLTSAKRLGANRGDRLAAAIAMRAGGRRIRTRPRTNGSSGSPSANRLPFMERITQQPPRQAERRSHPARRGRSSDQGRPILPEFRHTAEPSARARRSASTAHPLAGRVKSCRSRVSRAARRLRKFGSHGHGQRCADSVLVRLLSAG